MGRQPSTELAFKPAPVPRFEGMQIPGLTGGGGGGASSTSGMSSPTAGAFPPSALQPQLSGQGPIRVPPLDPQKAQQYSGLFERTSTQNGRLDGVTAKAIFDRAGLPNEVLGRIWNLSDREQKGSLDQTEFIVAMHLLTSMKSKAMTAVPNTLPPGLYEAAARRGAPPSRQGTSSGAVARQVTGSSATGVARAQSPLARPPGFATPPVQSAQTTGPHWLITAADKAKYDQYFNTIDPQGRGAITGDQAVNFFSNSRLSDELLAQIWDLADINGEGQLNKDEFAVAMYLIQQQRIPNAGPLPAFLPPALLPPSMRKQPQPPLSTDVASSPAPIAPRSATEDLFGLDQPSVPPAPSRQATLQPQGTGASASRDPFSGGQSSSPGSPQRAQSPQQTGTMFKPFIPTSQFGASLASQNTGGSTGSAARAASLPKPQQQTGTMDDLLGENDTNAEESSKITNDTTELANMSNQIGNLRSQMEQTQTKKTATQAELNATSAQKRDLEARLQQFRAQYEREVTAVKDLEKQLTTSRESTQKLKQDLAMLEGTYQDLQTQHQTVSQALQTDQQENASLKQRISQINSEVAKLKPEVEKIKLDARQQKGLVSINKKQLATNETERDRLQGEKTELEEAASTREISENAASPGPSSNIASPSTLSSTNPFFRKPSQEGVLNQVTASPAAAPTPSAFDALFGPSSAFSPTGQANSRTGTPPATSFIGRSMPATAATAAVANVTGSSQGDSSRDQPTPPAAPSTSEHATEDAHPFEAPPVEESREVPASTPSPALFHMPGSFTDDAAQTKSDPASLPGAFPADIWQPSGSDANSSTVQTPQASSATPAKDDFDSAFEGFGETEQAKDAGKQGEDPFAPKSEQAKGQGFSSEFPPIHSLEPEDEDDDSDDESEKKFDDDFTAASPPRNGTSVPIQPFAAQSGADTPKALPSYEESNLPSHGGTGERTEENQFPPEFGGLLAAREDPTSPPPPSDIPPVATEVTELPEEQESTSHAFEIPSTSTNAVAPEPTHPVQARAPLDDFDEFGDLSEAKEAEHGANQDFDFGFGRQSVDEFNPAFDSPARSMQQPESNGFHQSSTALNARTGSVQHDWDAIFSGLDHPNTVEPSLNDPWGSFPSATTSTTATTTNGAAAAATPATTSLSPPAIPPEPAAATKLARPPIGRALTPGTEHDDPILKRLTGMGYPRTDALNALEMYDYDINKVRYLRKALPSGIRNYSD